MQKTEVVTEVVTHEVTKNVVFRTFFVTHDRICLTLGDIGKV